MLQLDGLYVGAVKRAAAEKIRVMLWDIHGTNSADW